jgi:hypothetical protein
MIRIQPLTAMAAGALTAFGAVTASATTPIELGFNGDVQLVSGDVQFGTFPTGTPYAAAPGYGVYETSIVNPGVFATNGVTTAEFGTVESFNGTTTPANPFLTFNVGGSNLKFLATSVVTGATTGPFTIASFPGGSVAIWGVIGNVFDTNTQSIVETGDEVLFTAPAAGVSAGQLQADITGTGGIDLPFAATVGQIVPEPATGLLVVAAGGLMLNLRPRKRTHV